MSELIEEKTELKILLGITNLNFTNQKASVGSKEKCTNILDNTIMSANNKNINKKHILEQHDLLQSSAPQEHTIFHALVVSPHST